MEKTLMVLDKINTPEDLRGLSAEEMNLLSAEIRDLILKKVNTTGGHLGPNLGMVEATIALHRVFNSPVDKFVFDVSHQCYPHKILTGRKEGFTNPAKYHTYTGYTAPEESAHDLFKVGHTSTSVSLACGLAKARDLIGGKENVVAIIGDGSLTGGEALEGLNNAAVLGSNIIIVVNDNDMSIAENHGGLYSNLKLLRDTKGQAENNFFKTLGFDYYYIDNGHDFNELISVFDRVKDADHPVLVHMHTIKGKGLHEAEVDKEHYHWIVPGELDKKPVAENAIRKESYESITADYILDRASKDSSIIAISPATPGVSGFTPEFRKKLGKNYVDVGIAEETAVALASGIAANGGKPVFGVYSSFIQRAYDQITQDVCINGNAVTFTIFAGSVYGMNDVTHLGLQDIPMLNSIPGLVYLAPVTKEDYIAMLDWSLTQNAYPVAIKIPGGSMISTGVPVTKDFSKLDTYEITKKGSRVAILGLGTFYENAVKAADILKSSHGIDATVINPYYISGIDADTLNELKKDHAVVATLEDGYLEGGFGAKIAAFYGSSDMKVLNFGIKKEFIDRYDVSEVLKDNHLTPEQIAEDIAATL